MCNTTTNHAFVVSSLGFSLLCGTSVPGGPLCSNPSMFWNIHQTHTTTHTHSRTRSENTDTEHAHKVGWGRLRPFKRKIILDPYSAHVVGTPSNYPKHAQKKVLMLAYSCRISHTYTHTHLSNMARLVIVKVRISRSFTKLFLFAI